MTTIPGKATYMIYPVGAGLVFATMLTIEWGYGPFVANLVGSWRPSLLLDELESVAYDFGWNSTETPTDITTAPSPPTILPPPNPGGGGGAIGDGKVPIDKLALLAPFIGLGSLAVVVLSAVYLRRRRSTGTSPAKN